MQQYYIVVLSFDVREIGIYFLTRFYSFPIHYRTKRHPAPLTNGYPTQQYSSMHSIMPTQLCLRRTFSPIFTVTTMVESQSTGMLASSTALFRRHHWSTRSSVWQKSICILYRCIRRLSSTLTAVPSLLRCSMQIIVPVLSCFFLSHQTENRSCTLVIFDGLEKSCWTSHN